VSSEEREPTPTPEPESASPESMPSPEPTGLTYGILATIRRAVRDGLRDRGRGGDPTAWTVTIVNLEQTVSDHPAVDWPTVLYWAAYLAGTIVGTAGDDDDGAERGSDI
jgi:hypothetical protein